MNFFVPLQIGTFSLALETTFNAKVLLRALLIWLRSCWFVIVSSSHAKARRRGTVHLEAWPEATAAPSLQSGDDGTAAGSGAPAANLSAGLGGADQLERKESIPAAAWTSASVHRPDSLVFFLPPHLPPSLLC